MYFSDLSFSKSNLNEKNATILWVFVAQNLEKAFIIHQGPLKNPPECLRKVRRAAEQELFDLANRARSAEVMMGVVWCVFSPGFFPPQKQQGLFRSTPHPVTVANEGL